MKIDNGKKVAVALSDGATSLGLELPGDVWALCFACMDIRSLGMDDPANTWT